MIVDTHSHLSFKAYDNDRDEVIKRTQKEGVICIDIGTKYETSKRAIELAEKYEGIYAAIGMHPIHIKTDLLKLKMDDEEGAFAPLGEDFDKARYKDLVLNANQKTEVPREARDEGPEEPKRRRIVAIGEIGLDYYYLPSQILRSKTWEGEPKTKTRLEQFKQKQKEVFLQQLDLARELELPVIIHCRMAHQDLIEVLKSQIQNPKSQIPARIGYAEGVAGGNSKSQIKNSKLSGVIHCFTGTWEEAQKYLELGFYLGINGIIDKLDLTEVIKNTPLEKILLETDCPYLTPSVEGKKRNEPIFVKYIAKTIAKIKDLSYERVSETTTQNARKLFNI